MFSGSPFLDREFSRIYRADWWLMASIFLLIVTGCVMIASASFDYSLNNFGYKEYLFHRHLVFLTVSVIACMVMTQIPIAIWQRFAPLLLVGGFALLALILIPGVGHTNKGATRWLQIGGLTLQVSELVKFCLLVYLSSYLVRQQALVRNTFVGFLNPLIVIGGLVVLLLAEPDFGSVVVLVVASLGLLFLGGVRLGQFVTLVVVSILAIIAMIFSEEYRRERFFVYLDPWSHRLDGGYQLIESLIALGRGQWFGSGLGNSVQKQFFLPEAHNDFIFAVLCEELGLFGGLLFISIFVIMLFRIVSIARCAELLDKRFAAYYCYGVALILFIQLFINVGVNIGLLPTKGLTLPLLSYGGSSLLVTLCMLGVVFRVNRELIAELGAAEVRRGSVVSTDLYSKFAIRPLT